jgi:hypothetical protein
MAIDWTAIYNDELSKIEDPTTKINNLKAVDVGVLDAQKIAQEAAFGKNRDEALRQSYITREMNKKDLPMIMAEQGLNGGYTETAAMDLLRDYRNSANSANRGYNDSVTDLANTYGTNVASLNSSYGQQLLAALANRNTQATNNANIRAQIQQAEEQAALQREQWEWQKAQAAGTSQPSTQITATDNPTAPSSTSPSTYTGTVINPYTNAGYAWTSGQQAVNALDNQIVSTPYGTNYREKVSTPYGTSYRWI